MEDYAMIKKLFKSYGLDLRTEYRTFNNQFKFCLLRADNKVNIVEPIWEEIFCTQLGVEDFTKLGDFMVKFFNRYGDSETYLETVENKIKNKLLFYDEESAVQRIKEIVGE